MGLALSTSWNASRSGDGRAILLEIRRLGFREVELSFNLTGAMLQDIEGLAGDGETRVVSVHNYCPIPEGLKREDALPDCYSLASVDAAERETAVRYTLRSIDTAERLKARAVVLHCGRVEMPDLTRPLIQLFEKGKAGSDEFIGLRERAVRERAQKRGPFFDAALKSLSELAGRAQDKGIRLGIENRFYHREIPSHEEIGIILDTFPRSNIGYWHDVGHAQLMENLGFASHQAYLDAYGPKILGMHLHDIRGCRDHLPPSKGDFDFKRLIPCVTKDTVTVMEAHYPATGKNLQESREYLKRLFSDA